MLRIARLFSVLAMLCLSISPAWAQTDAAQVKFLSGIYAEAIQQVKSLKSQLEEMKVANDTAMQARQTLSDVREEYEFVARFNPQAELQNIIDDFDDLTNLNELMKSKSFDERWALAYGEIDKRFKRVPRNSDDGAAALQAKAALEQLRVMNQLRDTYLNEAVNLDAHASDKDLQVRTASATSMTASLMIDQKIHDIEAQIGRTESVISALDWDREFMTFLDGKQTAFADGPISSFLVNVLNPKYIYENIFKLTALIGFIPWLLALVIVTRHMQESASSMVGKARLADAFMNMGRTTLALLIYSAIGLSLFGFLFYFSAIFDGFGSDSVIYSQLMSLRSSLDTGGNKEKDFVIYLLSITAEVGNILTAGTLFWVYQAVTLIYVGVAQFIDVLFAIFTAVAYAWGYFAIATSALKAPLNMIEGWLKSIAILVVWSILTPFLLGILWLMTSSARLWLADAYGGVGIGITAAGVWQAYAICTLIFMIILKVMAVGLAGKLVYNQAMSSEFASAAKMVAGGAGLGAFNYANKNMNPVKSSMPNVKDGNRSRDGWAQRANDVLKSPMSDVARGAAGGLGDLSGKVARGAANLTARMTGHVTGQGTSVGGQGATSGERGGGGGLGDGASSNNAANTEQSVSGQPNRATGANEGGLGDLGNAPSAATETGA